MTNTVRETLWDPIAGFGVTFRTMFKKVVTEQYPFEKVPTAPRFHGRHQLNRWPDGLEKCIGCELCAWACPADAIYVEGASNSEDGRFSPGERYGRVYQINYLRCILCGLCIEACPTRALTMTNEYELADDNRADLIYEKSDLLAPLLPGMVEPPHAMLISDDHQRLLPGQDARPPPHRSRRRGRRQPARLHPGRTISDDVLDPRAGHGRRRPRAGVRPQGGARGALPGHRHDRPRGAVRRPGRAVPVRGADHRLHRRDHDAVPLRADAGRRRHVRLPGRDHQGPAAMATVVGLLFGVTAVIAIGQGVTGAVTGLDGANEQRQPVRPGGAAVRPVRARVRAHQRPAHHRGARRDGAGAPREAHRATQPGRPRAPAACATTPRPASTPATRRRPASSRGTTPSTPRPCCPTVARWRSRSPPASSPVVSCATASRTTSRPWSASSTRSSEGRRR